jgi:hypothetical protein
MAAYYRHFGNRGSNSVGVGMSIKACYRTRPLQDHRFAARPSHCPLVAFVVNPDARWAATSMTPDEREWFYELCFLIQHEKDDAKFLELVRQLNDLLERTERPLETQPAKPDAAP